MKHSISIAGHQTSITLEEEFWTELKLIAARRGISLNRLVAEVDSARTGNLSSALRLYVLADLKEGRNAPALPRHDLDHHPAVD
jgi:predicted DNA-binding ribbon-helix-helix protein